MRDSSNFTIGQALNAQKVQAHPVVQSTVRDSKPITTDRISTNERKKQIRQSTKQKMLESSNSNETQQPPAKFKKFGRMLMNVNKVKASVFERSNTVNQQLGTGGGVPSIATRFNVPVRLDFETKKQKEARVAMKREQIDKQKRNIHDYVKKDDSDLNHMVKTMAYAVREHKYFKMSIVGVEVLHMLLVIVHIILPELCESYITKILHEYVKPIAASTYVVEMAVNWIAGFEVYLTDGFCVIDILATIPFIISQYLQASWDSLEWLIMFRIFRFLFRYVAKTDYLVKVNNKKPTYFQKQVLQLKLVVDTIEKSIQEIIYTMGLLIIVFLLFSVAIIELSGKYCDHFSTVGKCIWSFFTAVTMDGWVDIVDDLERQVFPKDLPDFFDKGERQFAYYFGSTIMLVLIVIGGFVFNNLFVAIVVAKLDISLQQEKKLDSVIDSAQNVFVKKNDENEKNEDGVGGVEDGMTDMVAEGEKPRPSAFGNNPDLEELEDADLDLDEPVDDIVPILPYKDVKKLYEPLAQMNINNQEITKISIGRVEDFFAMIYALEANLVEYNRLRIKLDDIISTIYKINEQPDNHELAMEILGVKDDHRKSKMQERANGSGTDSGGDSMYDLRF